MAVPPFIEFGERIVNTARIVTISPPRRTQDGFEIEARVDGFSHKEIYGDVDEADDRYAEIASTLLDLPPAPGRIESEDRSEITALLASLAES